MYVKAFIVNVNKSLKRFFLELHINIVNGITLQSFWFICIRRKLFTSTNEATLVKGGSNPNDKYVLSERAL